MEHKRIEKVQKADIGNGCIGSGGKGSAYGQASGQAMIRHMHLPLWTAMESNEHFFC